MLHSRGYGAWRAYPEAAESAALGTSGPLRFTSTAKMRLLFNGRTQSVKTYRPTMAGVGTGRRWMARSIPGST